MKSGKHGEAGAQHRPPRRCTAPSPASPFARTTARRYADDEGAEKYGSRVVARDDSHWESTAASTLPKNSLAWTGFSQRTTTTIRRSGSIQVKELPAPTAK
jgi:hypothetical protein